MGNEYGADDRGVDQSGCGQTEAHHLEVDHSERGEEREDDADFTSAALVTTLPVALMPWATASSVLMCSRTAEDQHVVVHRNAGQHDERDQRQPVRHTADRGEAVQCLQVTRLEAQHEHAVGRADREHVEAIAVSWMTIGPSVTSGSRNTSPSTNAKTIAAWDSSSC